ncbi:L-dopachrome tautomerase-related protein [Phormidesmis sp. 146-12]
MKNAAVRRLFRFDIHVVWRVAIAGLVVLVLGLIIAIATHSQPSKLEVLAELQQMPGNIAVTDKGRILISQHQFAQPDDRVIELLPSGQIRPFPNDTWSRAPNSFGVGLDSVLGLRATSDGRVWLLDNGMRQKGTPKLVVWDTHRNALDQVIHLPYPTTLKGSFLNDLAIDLKHRQVYISDVGTPTTSALVIVDLKTGRSRRVLQGHQSVVFEEVSMTVEGRKLTRKNSDGTLSEPRLGVNPITIDPSYEWVYFGAMHSRSLYRIQTTNLSNDEMPSTDLAARVERYGEKPLSGGITVDSQSNVYITDLEGSAIGVTANNGRYSKLINDVNALRWPDGICIAPNGYLYVVTSKLHLSPLFNGGKDETAPPYLVARFKGLASSTVGR